MSPTQPPLAAQDAKTRTYLAEEALTAGVIVVEGTDQGEVKLPAAEGEGLIVGVVKEDAAIDTPVEIYKEGIVPCQSSAAITRGKPIAIGGATGKGIDAAPGSGANHFIAGFARTGNSGADWFLIELVKSVMQGA